MSVGLGEAPDLRGGAMHPCGPLAMATPLHTFPATRLEVEDSSPLPPAAEMAASLLTTTRVTLHP